MNKYDKPPLSEERLKKIRILAFDLDDTLLDDRGMLSEGNRAALLRAMEKGFHAVISTGRVLAALPGDVLSAGVRYAVTSNGARVTDLHTGKAFYENLIPAESVDAVRPWLRDEDVMLEIFFDGEVYARRSDLAHLADFGRTSEKSQRYVLATRKPSDDLAGLLEANRTRLENINLVMKNDEKRRRWLSELGRIPGVTVCSSTPDNIEIGGPHTSKAAALEILAAKLGLGPENIMAFGDSGNDEQMLRHAGIGVAMGNAVPELLEAADYIAPDHDADGAAFVLERLLGI